MSIKKLVDIDPAFDLMHEFSQMTKGTPASIQKMRQTAIFSDGILPVKHKALAAALWSISARCEPCIKFYVQEAAKHGASKEELGEFLAVASTMGGCVGEMWALKAYKAFVEAISAESSTSEPTCCSHE